jgi:hypothetical protein
MVLGNTLPYGLRDVKIIPYPDSTATTFGSTLLDLPVARTFSFNEDEDFDDLRGDDQLITSHGQGPQVDWQLESGGLSFGTFCAIAGGQVITTGISPNQVNRLRKKVTDQRPFFTVVGMSISDNGGDFQGIVYRARATDKLEHELGDGEFLIPTASGTGFPCNVTGLVNGVEINGTVYDFVQRETAGTIAAPILDTPTAPSIYSLSDSGGPVAGGEIIRAAGYYPGTITGVTVGGTAATDWELESVNMLVLITPAHAAGAAQVVATNATGSSSTSAATTYTYV